MRRQGQGAGEAGLAFIWVWGGFVLVLGCPLSCFPACRCCSGENCTVMAPCAVWGGRWVRTMDGAMSSSSHPSRAAQSPVVPVKPQQRLQGKGSPQQSLAAAENTLVQPNGASTLALAEVTWGWM